MRVLDETAKGRKVPTVAQDSAITIFFTARISFNLISNIFILYINPIHKGKRTIKMAEGFFENDRMRAEIYEAIVIKVKIFLCLPINLALSGKLIESSSILDNLSRLYTAKVRRKEEKSNFESLLMP